MTPRLVSAALVAAAAACAGLEPAAAAAFASIVRVALPPEDQERQPFAVPTEPENTLEVDLPWPLEDWAGRGFTPDAEKYAGDFEIEASRGADRLFITPVAQGAHRVLHLVLAPTASRRRSLTLSRSTQASRFSCAGEVSHPRIVQTRQAHVWCACSSSEVHCQYRPAQPKQPRPWRFLLWRAMTLCG